MKHASKSLRAWFAAVALLAGFPVAGVAESVWDKETPALEGQSEITVYRSPTCSCCGKWLDHMSKQGFHVNDVISENMDEIKRKFGVSPKLASCHTALINGYVIEGHVPAGDVKKLLRDKPAVAGIALPGMVVGSPGMEMGGKKEPFAVLSFDKTGNTAVFSDYSSY